MQLSYPNYLILFTNLVRFPLISLIFRVVLVILNHLFSLINVFRILIYFLQPNQIILIK